MKDVLPEPCIYVCLCSAVRVFCFVVDHFVYQFCLCYVADYNNAGALEKYVQGLEKKHKFDLLRTLYASVNGRSVDDAQMVEFFKMKFWM